LREIDRKENRKEKQRRAEHGRTALGRDRTSMHNILCLFSYLVRHISIHETENCLWGEKQERKAYEKNGVEHAIQFFLY
jgi:hypothetical protein